MRPVLQPLLRYAADLERAAADHPDEARRLLAEAAETWLWLGRRDRAVAPLRGRRGGVRRRPPPVVCQRPPARPTVVA